MAGVVVHASVLGRPGKPRPRQGARPRVGAWGFDRCLWRTDWTRAFAVVNYEPAVEPFLETDRLSDTERAMLLGAACDPRLMAGRQRKLITPFWPYSGDQVGSANYRYWPRPPASVLWMVGNGA
jgi:hypothetical protein